MRVDLENLERRIAENKLVRYDWNDRECDKGCLIGSLVPDSNNLLDVIAEGGWPEWLVYIYTRMFDSVEDEAYRVALARRLAKIAYDGRQRDWGCAYRQLRVDVLIPLAIDTLVEAYGVHRSLLDEDELYHKLQRIRYSGDSLPLSELNYYGRLECEPDGRADEVAAARYYAYRVLKESTRHPEVFIDYLGPVHVKEQIEKVVLSLSRPCSVR